MYKNLLKIIQNQPNSHHIYTDASILTDDIGLAVIIENKLLSCKLSPKCSIYTTK